MFSKKVLTVTLGAAGLFAAAALTLDVDIRVNSAWAAAAPAKATKTTVGSQRMVMENSLPQ